MRGRPSTGQALTAWGDYGRDDPFPCLGAALARMEGTVALGSLLRRFPEFRLAVPADDLHWNHRDGLVPRGLSELPVVPGPSATR